MLLQIAKQMPPTPNEPPQPAPGIEAASFARLLQEGKDIAESPVTRRAGGAHIVKPPTMHSYFKMYYI